MNRRLAAILAADVAGYSRLVEQDEAGTLAALKERRKAILDPTVVRYHGRVVKVMGDGVLVEFGSAVKAVACAVELQSQFVAANAAITDDRRIVLRVGINLGDVVVEGGDLYGDGVIIAVRLQEMADPGGVCISGAVHEQVAGKLDAAFEDLGHCEVKNSSKPMHVYRVQPGGDTTPVRPALALPDKPSIAVLPFQNMSGDTAKEYFADGITEDIITELSRFRSLFVIARNSSFQYRDKRVDVRRVARELGVRYVVEGSVRTMAKRIRITAQLIDAASSAHLWSERYDRDIDDLFEIQDEVIRSIAAKLSARLETAEIVRIRRKPAENLLAHECIYQAKALMNAAECREIEAVRHLLEKAAALDSASGRAHSLLAMTFVFDVQRTGLPEHLDMAMEQASLALAADNQDCWSHYALGIVCLERRQFEQAYEHYSLAVSLNPNDADILANMGDFLSYSGRPEEGIGWIIRAMRLNPLHPPYYWDYLAGAYYDCHRYEEAVTAFLQMYQPFWSQDVYLAACYGQLGNTKKATQHAEEVRKQMPNFSARDWVGGEPYKHEKDVEHWFDGLRKAGLPE